MYEYVIAQYIKNLTTTDIINFAKNKGIIVSDKDANLLLQVAKKDWELFYKGDPSLIIAKLKQELDPTTFEFGINLYYEMKEKITNMNS